MNKTTAEPRLNNQTVGNIGLYYVCYRLSRLGWNVMPTARNARGIDIVMYSQSGKRTSTVQVKALSNRAPVPLGTGLDNFIADHVVVSRRVCTESPESFVLSPDDIRRLAHKGVKDGKTSYWLQPASYEREEFRERWDRIGAGA